MFVSQTPITIIMLSVHNTIAATYDANNISGDQKTPLIHTLIPTIYVPTVYVLTRSVVEGHQPSNRLPILVRAGQPNVVTPMMTHGSTDIVFKLL